MKMYRKEADGIKRIKNLEWNTYMQMENNSRSNGYVLLVLDIAFVWETQADIH